MGQLIGGSSNADLQNLPLATAGGPSLQGAVTPPFLKSQTTPQPATPPPTPDGMTKGAKLANILRSGLQGALAGRAASEKTIAETGGRRAGGAGTGFEAALMQPYQIAGAQQQLEQAKAQTALTKSQTDMVDTPYGKLPPALAKVIFPAAIRGAAQENVAGQNVAGRENVAQTQATSRENVAQTNKRFMAVPGVGLYDTQAKQILPGSQQGITVTPEIAKDYNLPQEFIGKPLTMQNFGTLERANEFGSVVTEGAAGPALVQRNPTSPNYGQVKQLGLGNPGVATAQARPVQVAPDPENPGAVTYAPAGQAMRQQLPSPQAAPTQAARTAARSEVPTKIGDQKVAFNTAIQHAQLLENAAKALQNGDVQTLNSIQNRFSNEFGSAGPVTAQAIADAYTREITKMLSAGHLTDAEISTVGKTLDPTRQNMQQVQGVISAYRALSQSKLNMLNQQEKSATKGNAKSSKNDPLGIR